MAFQFRVTAVEYDSFGETVLTGVLESGQIGGGDPICVPTASGTLFKSVVSSMEGPGPDPPPFRADKIGKATLIVGVEGTPTKKDVVVPCIAEGYEPAAAPDQPSNSMRRPRLPKNDALTDPSFWAMHYYLLIGTEEEDATEFVEPFFGVSNEVVNDYFVREFDVSSGEGAWPYLEVPIRDGFTVQVEYAGAPNSETRFYINHVEWPQPLSLGHESGHFALPALRWCEVEAIGRACPGIEGARALLLLFPSVFVSEEDDTRRVQSALVEAWAQLAVANRVSIEEMAGHTIEHCTVDIQWWKDERLGWITDGRYSFRNPKTLMCEFDEDRFAKVAAFFAGIESGR